MRRTNSKEVRNAVEAYILEVTEMQDLGQVYSKFISEYGHMVHRLGENNACIEWLQGLGISVEYGNAEIVELLASWLNDTVESQHNWYIKKGSWLYWYLIAREIVNKGSKILNAGR